jgi:hypothetical protein
MKSKSKSKCLHCQELFLPDYRNRGRQRHCAKPECRKAAKAQSQRLWLSRPENRDYFRGPENCRRVREWRAQHPGYWRHKKPAGQEALQEGCPAQEALPKEVAPAGALAALQEACLMQPAMLVGLISTLTGSALQEDIARSARSFLVRGQDILGLAPEVSHLRSADEKQTSSLSTAAAARAAPV